jgi:hypothetical protein
MATITFRTTEDKKDRLAQLAKEKDISVNKVIDELVTIALTERDAFLRFSARAKRGNPAEALKILAMKAGD